MQPSTPETSFKYDKVSIIFQLAKVFTTSIQGFPDQLSGFDSTTKFSRFLNLDTGLIPAENKLLPAVKQLRMI